MTTAGEIVRAYPRAASVAPHLIATSAALGIDPAWLANVVQFESGWNPQARNPASGATGLIQFMPRTAASLGTSTDALFRMTAEQQWPYIDRYLQRHAGRLHSQLDTYMAIFYPVAVGKGGDYRFPERVTRYNPGIRTAADYASYANRRARLSPSSAPPKVATSSLRRGGAGAGIEGYRRVILATSAAVFALVAAAALVARRRQGW